MASSPSTTSDLSLTARFLEGVAVDAMAVTPTAAPSTRCFTPADGSFGSMPLPAGSSARSRAAASTDSQPSFPGRSRLLRGLSASSQGQWPSSGVDGTTRIPPSGTESPMTRSRLIIAAAAVIVAVAVGGFIVYDQVLRGDSAAALALPTASTASSAPAASAAAAASGAPAASAGTSAASDRRRRGHLERGGRQRRRLPRPRAARQPAGRERRGRSHGPGHRLDHARDLRDGDDPDRRRRSPST